MYYTTKCKDSYEKDGAYICAVIFLNSFCFVFNTKTIAKY